MKTHILLTLIHPGWRLCIDRLIDLPALPQPGSGIRVGGFAFEVKNLELVFQDGEAPFHVVCGERPLSNGEASTLPDRLVDFDREGWETHFLPSLSEQGRTEGDLDTVIQAFWRAQDPTKGFPAPEKAIQIGQALVEAGLSLAHLWLGDLHMRRGIPGVANHARAEFHYLMAAEKGITEAHAGLGHLFDLQERPGDAVAAWARFFDDPGFPAANPAIRSMQARRTLDYLMWQVLRNSSPSHMGRILLIERDLQEPIETFAEDHPALAKAIRLLVHPRQDF